MHYLKGFCQFCLNCCMCSLSLSPSQWWKPSRLPPTSRPRRMCASCRSSTIRTCFSKCPASSSPKICNRANHLPSCHSDPSLLITKLSASPSQLDCWKSSEMCQDIQQELLLLESGLWDGVKCYTAHLFTHNVCNISAVPPTSWRPSIRSVEAFLRFSYLLHSCWVFFSLFQYFFCEICPVCTAISGTEANVVDHTTFPLDAYGLHLFYLTLKNTPLKHETIWPRGL